MFYTMPRIPCPGAEIRAIKRRGGDSNPRCRLPGTMVFKTLSVVSHSGGFSLRERVRARVLHAGRGFPFYVRLKQPGGFVAGARHEVPVAVKHNGD